MNLTPKARDLEESELIMLIRAIESDISNPIKLTESIERDEAQIKALQHRVDSAKERRVRLPELLASFREQLIEVRKRKAANPVDKRIKKLLEMKGMINELLRQTTSNS
jgi:predicted RNase H-like nuclease (RuvC/YqgF family)